MVGAFLKYGKLAAAQPCPPYKCGPPAGSFAKKFEITDRVWNDILYDLDAQETIKTINEIENEVLIFGANMIDYILLLQIHTILFQLNENLLKNENMIRSGANGVFIKSMKPNPNGDGIEINAQINIAIDVSNVNTTMEELIGTSEKLVYNSGSSF